MKKGNNFLTEKKMEILKDVSWNDYMEMFQDGFSDSEISNELGINEEYIRKLRDEYQEEY